MNFVINRNSPVPYYYQIEEWIRQLIARGELKPGDPLESEISLAQKLGVSRITVRQALNDLTEQGLLVRKRALGTTVAERRKSLLMYRAPLRGLTEEMAAEGLKVTSQVLEQEVVPAAEDVQKALELPPQAEVVLIRRLRSVNGLPLCVEVCYHPLSLFPRLALMDLTNRSIYEILEQEYQRRPVSARDIFTADTAHGQLARWLQLPAGAAVMRIQRLAWDQSGTAVETSVSIFRADQHQLVIEYRG
jgi:GntR family transcriptional regulator